MSEVLDVEEQLVGGLDDSESRSVIDHSRDMEQRTKPYLIDLTVRSNQVYMLREIPSSISFRLVLKLDNRYQGTE